uniref:PPM-type phosphatase domain-containing protein n=1 Tax=Tanacetum cinerariifolium TaxID=118510 RepID=A0A6L2LY30_TANCI|nr:hypothetical protein [Tanacetum cinerariifolium]
MLATRHENNSLVPVQLTIDLKPNLPREAARIEQFNGRGFALQDEPEVARVWLPHNVFYHRITDEDEFVILATDAVWDVLSNKEAIETAALAEQLQSELLSTAVDKEVKKSDIDLVDQPALGYSGTVRYTNEIVPDIEATQPEKSIGVSKRSLGECITTPEDEKWSAFEGVTRANSLLSIPSLSHSGTVMGMTLPMIQYKYDYKIKEHGKKNADAKGFYTMIDARVARKIKNKLNANSPGVKIKEKKAE